MVDLKFKLNGGPVIIRVSVEGAVSRKYTYFADEKRFKGDAVKPSVHVLGMPPDLHLDYNKWVFRLINQADEALGYTVRIVWEQDGTEIDRWEQKKSLPPGSAVREEADERFLIGE